jgi:hypothetical protein
MELGKYSIVFGRKFWIIQKRLLDALGNQGWNAMAIKDVVDQMSNMIKEYHESFEGICFSGFVRGARGPTGNDNHSNSACGKLWGGA